MTPGGPCLQIPADLLRRSLAGENNDMDVIRAAIHGMESPAAVLARFRDLPLDHIALFLAQATRLLRHARLRFKLAQGVGTLPALPVLDLAPRIAWQPRAVGGHVRK